MIFWLISLVIIFAVIMSCHAKWCKYTTAAAKSVLK